MPTVFQGGSSGNGGSSSPTTSIVLGFALNRTTTFDAAETNSDGSDGSAANEQRRFCVFAHLPVGYVGLRFIVQASWALVSSRQQLRLDSAWNLWLRKQAATAFAEAIAADSELRSMLGTLLPQAGEVTDPFFSPMVSMIEEALNAKTCLRAESGKYMSPSNLLVRPPPADTQQMANGGTKIVTNEELREATGFEFVDASAGISYQQSLRLGANQFQVEHMLQCLNSEGMVARHVCADHESSDQIDSTTADWLLHLYDYLHRWMRPDDAEAIALLPIFPTILADNQMGLARLADGPIYTQGTLSSAMEDAAQSSRLHEMSVKSGAVRLFYYKTFLFKEEIPLFKTLGILPLSAATAVECVLEQHLTAQFKSTSDVWNGLLLVRNILPQLQGTDDCPSLERLRTELFIPNNSNEICSPMELHIRSILGVDCPCCDDRHGDDADNPHSTAIHGAPKSAEKDSPRQQPLQLHSAAASENVTVSFRRTAAGKGKAVFVSTVASVPGVETWVSGRVGAEDAVREGKMRLEVTIQKPGLYRIGFGHAQRGTRLPGLSLTIECPGKCTARLWGPTVHSYKHVPLRSHDGSVFQTVNVGDVVTVAIDLDAFSAYFAINDHLVQGAATSSLFKSDELAAYAFPLPVHLAGMSIVPIVATCGGEASTQFTMPEISCSLLDAAGFLLLGSRRARGGDTVRAMSLVGSLKPTVSGKDSDVLIESESILWEAFLLSIGCRPHYHACMKRHWWSSLSDSIEADCTICMLALTDDPDASDDDEGVDDHHDHYVHFEGGSADYSNVKDGGAAGAGVGASDGKNSGAMMSVLSCNHRFHADCVAKWFAVSGSNGCCPVCRKNATVINTCPIAVELSENALSRGFGALLRELGNTKTPANRAALHSLLKEYSRHPFVRALIGSVPVQSTRGLHPLSNVFADAYQPYGEHWLPYIRTRGLELIEQETLKQFGCSIALDKAGIMSAIETVVNRVQDSRTVTEDGIADLMHSLYGLLDRVLAQASTTELSTSRAGRDDSALPSFWSKPLIYVGKAQFATADKVFWNSDPAVASALNRQVLRERYPSFKTFFQHRIGIRNAGIRDCGVAMIASWQALGAKSYKHESRIGERYNELVVADGGSPNSSDGLAESINLVTAPFLNAAADIMDLLASDAPQASSIDAIPFPPIPVQIVGTTTGAAARRRDLRQHHQGTEYPLAKIGTFALLNPGYAGDIFLNDHENEAVFELFKSDLGCIVLPGSFIEAPTLLNALLQRGNVLSFAAGLTEGPISVQDASKSMFLTRVAESVLLSYLPWAAADARSGTLDKVEWGSTNLTDAIHTVTVSRCSSISQPLDLQTPASIANKEVFASRSLIRAWHLEAECSISIDTSNVTVRTSAFSFAAAKGALARGNNGNGIRSNGNGGGYMGSTNGRNATDDAADFHGSGKLLDVIANLADALNHLVSNVDALEQLGNPTIGTLDILDAWERVQEEFGADGIDSTFAIGNEGDGDGDGGQNQSTHPEVDGSKDAIQKLASELDAMMNGDGSAMHDNDGEGTPADRANANQDARAVLKPNTSATASWHAAKDGASSDGGAGSKSTHPGASSAPPLSVVQPDQLLKLLDPMLKQQLALEQQQLGSANDAGASAQANRTDGLQGPAFLQRTVQAPHATTGSSVSSIDFAAQTNQVSLAVAETWAYLYLLTHLPPSDFGPNNWVALANAFAAPLAIAGLPEPKLGRLPYAFSFVDTEERMSATSASAGPSEGGPVHWLVGVKVGGSGGGSDGGGSGSSAMHPEFLLTSDEVELCNALGVDGFEITREEGTESSAKGSAAVRVRFMLLHVDVPAGALQHNRPPTITAVTENLAPRVCDTSKLAPVMFGVR